VVCIGTVGDVIVWGGRHELNTPYGTLKVLALGDATSAPEIINKEYISEFKLDIIIGFMDAFGIEYLNKVRIPVIGYELLKFFPPSKIDYIPHGIDTETFKPLKNREEIREKLEREHGIPRNSILYMCTAANVGPRKELPLLMHTFKRFVEQGYDAHLYIHTNAYMQYPRGYDLLQWREMLKMEKHIHFPRYNPIVRPASEKELAELYNAADVYVSNSVAEGFGLPIAEALSCGTPVICPDNSAQVELARGHGWLTRNVPTDMYFQMPVYVPMLTKYPVPDQNSLLENLKESYERPDLRKKYGEAGRKFIVERHSWDVVIQKWFSFLEEVENELELFSEVLRGLQGRII